MRKFLYFVFCILATTHLHAIAILEISSKDGKSLNLTLNQKKLEAVIEGENSFYSESGTFSIPLNTHKTQVTRHQIAIYDSGNYLGQITLTNYPKGEYFGNQIPWLIMGFCDFDLPRAPDVYSKFTLQPVSNNTRNFLWQSLQNWDLGHATTLKKFSDQKNHALDELMHSCLLISQYIAALKPQFHFSNELKTLNLQKKLDKLESGSCRMLCGGFSLLFTDIFTAITNQYPIRTVNEHRWYDKNSGLLHPNSHVGVEIYHKNRWVYFDPTHRLYWAKEDDLPLSASAIQQIVKNKKEEILYPVTLEDDIPFLQAYYEMEKERPSWCTETFGWLIYSTLQNYKRF